MAVNVVVKKFGAGSVEIQVSVDTGKTVAEFKEQIAAQVDLPQDNIRLVCAGRVWDNIATVSLYNPTEGSIIHCLNNPQRQAPAPETQTLQPVNPMQQMMGSMGPVNGNSGDPMDQMMAQSQQMMMQNPEMMQQLMNSPWVQQMLDNPEMLRGMMRMNPRMNELMESRPEIARMMDDPDMLRQSVRMMSNPSLMREMTRNADRALGNLDAMPGGHQALVRAHEEYIDPLYNAMSSSSNGGAAGVNSYTAESAPNTEALANPWGPPPAAAPAPSPTPAMGQPSTPASNPLMPSAGAMGMNANQQGGNPMQQMMQQMMQNPAMMQQAMTMAQGMQQQPPAAAQTPTAAQAPFGAAQAPFGAAANPMGMGMGMNPFQQMMMQNMMNPSGTQPLAGQSAAGQPGQPPAVPEAVQRVRYASQLQQLAGMGFTDESKCLRALAQHDGRLDSAIDVLLSGGGE